MGTDAEHDQRAEEKEQTLLEIAVLAGLAELCRGRHCYAFSPLPFSADFALSPLPLSEAFACSPLPFAGSPPLAVGAFAPFFSSPLSCFSSAFAGFCAALMFCSILAFLCSACTRRCFAFAVSSACGSGSTEPPTASIAARAPLLTPISFTTTLRVS